MGSTRCRTILALPMSELASSLQAQRQPVVRDPIVGIDLGTTNSLVAYCTDAGPRVLGGGADGAVEATEPFVAFFPVGGFGEGLIEVEGEQAPEAGGAQRDGAAGLGSGTDF